ncbi:MAG TPA: PqqD family protein [Rhodothermales bacterium]|nr:PqqD family protein [Rhodothermales bacterium]
MTQTNSGPTGDASTFSVSIRPHVAHENFDGEVIILNLNIGLYHALNETAGFIWSRMADHEPTESIVQEMASEYGISVEVARAMFLSFVGAIEHEELVDVKGSRPEGAAQHEGQTRKAGAPVTWPVMDTYRDMQHALVLDPIHEVDESGWPVVKVQKPTNWTEK